MKYIQTYEKFDFLKKKVKDIYKITMDNFNSLSHFARMNKSVENDYHKLLKKYNIPHVSEIQKFSEIGIHELNNELKELLISHKLQVSEKLNENVQLINEDINPYAGYYKVRDLNKVMNDLREKGIFFKIDENRNIIVEDNLNTAQQIIYENGGMMDFEWLDFKEDPSDGVILKSPAFNVPKGAMM